MKPLNKTRIQAVRMILQIIFFLLFLFSFLYLDATALIVVMAVSFAGGSWYCGWACPLGTAQDAISRIGKMIFGRRPKIPAWLERYASWMRYPLLGLSMAGFFYVDFLGDPLKHFTGLMAGHTAYVEWTAWGLLGAFLSLSLLLDRPFCRYFCFEGAKYGLLSMFRVFGVKRNIETCVHCLACDRACPAQIKISEKAGVRHPGCNNCLECVASCPVKGCLAYGLSVPAIAGKKEGNDGKEE